MKAAIYCRLSDEDERSADESESIQNQKAMLLHYALEQGYDVVGMYVDENWSGADRNRPAFNQMLRAAEKLEFEILLVKTQARFSRDAELTELCLHRKFPEWGIRFLSLVDHADTDNAANKKTRQINALVDEWYLEDISRNVRAALETMRQQGKNVASLALYGYRKDPQDRHHLIPDPAASQVVRAIFHMASKGMGASHIALVLNTQNISCPSQYRQFRDDRLHTMEKRMWNDVSVTNILKNPTYTGDMVQGRIRSSGYKTQKRVRVPKEEWVVVPNTHEALVEKEVFEKIQQQMAERRVQSQRPPKIRPLSGLVKCGVCGGNMIFSGNDRVCAADGYPGGIMRCSRNRSNPMECQPNKIRLHLLEEEVQKRIRSFLKHYYLPSEAPPLPREKENETIRKKRRQLETELQRCTTLAKQLYLEKCQGRLSTEAFMQKNAELSRQQAAARMELNQLPRDCSVRLMNNEEKQQKLLRMRVLKDSLILNRELCRSVIREIIVHPAPPTGRREIEIRWKF